MTRDYRKLLRNDGVYVPRAVFRVAIALGIVWMAWRIFVPPSWLVQRLDSPDGKRAAQLMRTRYLRENFVVRLKDGLFWSTAFYSATITNDYRVDLGERLSWSEDSSRVYFRLREKNIWGYDFSTGSDISPDELARSKPPSRDPL